MSTKEENQKKVLRQLLRSRDEKSPFAFRRNRANKIKI